MDLVLYKLGPKRRRSYWFWTIPKFQQERVQDNERLGIPQEETSKSTNLPKLPRIQNNF